jgi:hypothetical protein
MRDYHLHELDDGRFEELVIHLCDEVLGIGTVCFATGKDGGRDGFFSGTANAYPSKASPWSGKFVIQSKVTANPAASCSDAEFENNVLKKEIPRIEKLRDAKEVDNYLMFTNRKLTGGADTLVRNRLGTAAGTKNVAIIGRERIALLLNKNPNIVRLMRLNVAREPLRIRNDDLKHLIEALVATGFKFEAAGDVAGDFSYPGMGVKNSVNGVTPEYYEYIEENSLPYFDRVKEFLENPINETLRHQYFNIADEFKQRLLRSRPEYATFDELLTHFYDEILDQIPGLEINRRLVSVFIHFMYCNCEIGKK